MDPMQQNLEVLYEDGPCLVVNKPPGILTQAPPGIDSLEVRIKAYFGLQPEGPKYKNYLGVPHRLDRPASGAMVFGRTVKATRRLAEQFERREVKKIYWALVEGLVEPADGTWEDHIRKVPGAARAEIVDAGHPEGRLAILHYRTLGATASGCWLEIELETGRTHQIRIQAASRAHPVLGDAQYGSTVSFGAQHDDQRRRAVALHARSLAFCHPTNRQHVEITAPSSGRLGRTATAGWQRLDRMRSGGMIGYIGRQAKRIICPMRWDHFIRNSRQYGGRVAIPIRSLKRQIQKSQEER